MIFNLRNIRFPVSQHYDLKGEIGKKLGIASQDVELSSIIRKAVDTRRKNHPIYDFTVAITNSIEHLDINPYPEVNIPEFPPIVQQDKHPYIIGMGPAGLFCALAMVNNGLQPILFDQGDELVKRAVNVQDYWSNGALDEDSNVQFGEGGAGAFSDGKLTSRSRDWCVQEVYSQLIRFGADASIAHEALPHLGTDGIRTVVSKIREYLLEKGCQFQYSSKLTDIEIDQGHLKSIRINNETHHPQTLILALGNSARQSFRMLHKKGLALEPKPFAVGVRIEQSQALINNSIYGSEKWVPILGPATYRLTHNGTYTFCMCPGGFVIGAASEQGTVVTNGMSFASRTGDRCNSALVTSVDSQDYGSGLFAGVDFQQHIEKAAGLNGYHAPAQMVDDFLLDRVSSSKIISTYQPGTYSGNISTLLPNKLSNGIKSALHKFNSTVYEFCKEAVLIAPETRSSSPLRILRHKENRCSISCADIYPIGEGSGYSGGIISSAADGYSLGLRLLPEIKV